MNSAWSGTVYEVLQAHTDTREEVDIPPMTKAEQMRFAKTALANIPGAKIAFNNVFGGVQKVSDYVPQKLVGGDATPAFLWCAK